MSLERTLKRRALLAARRYSPGDLKNTARLLRYLVTEWVRWHVPLAELGLDEGEAVDQVVELIDRGYLVIRMHDEKRHGKAGVWWTIEPTERGLAEGAAPLPGSLLQ